MLLLSVDIDLRYFPSTWGNEKHSLQRYNNILLGITKIAHLAYVNVNVLCVQIT